MPEIKLQHVISASSEDKNYPADNLLKGDGFKKWKSAGVGEKQVSVTLQFEKASKIDKIDIGNEGSAFVEVFVAKSSATGDDFQVILVASAFMNPLDSRAGKNMTSVRMFTADKLSSAVKDQKWDKVKIVCTQPFNKTIQYGLAFIKFHSPPEEGSSSTAAPSTVQTKLGGFKLKADEDNNIKTGSLFFNRDKEKVTPAPLTGAAAVRAASRLAEESQKATDLPKPALKRLPTTPGHTPRDTNQMKRKLESDDEPSNSKRLSVDSKQSSNSSSSKSSKDSASSLRRSSTDAKQSSVTPLRKHSTSISSVLSHKSQDTPPLKKSKSEATKPQKDVAFGDIMKKVVFVMSGYQNPERGKLRDKAMEMGADYRPDWGKGCTHLICAFENTPKYSQVKGKGRIVNKTWITDCYKAKTLLPWRKYRVGRARSPGGSSEDESEDEIPVPKQSKSELVLEEKLKPSTSKSPMKREDSDPYGGDTDSGEDTDDEIRKVKEAGEKKARSVNVSPKKEVIENDIFSATTDEEMDTDEEPVTNGNSHLPELPDIFNRKKFFFYGKLDDAVRRKMKRFVVAYNGICEEYMTGDVTYVLTESAWDDNFDQALSDNPSLLFISPDWLYSCDEKQKYVPYQKYAIIPK